MKPNTLTRRKIQVWQLTLTRQEHYSETDHNDETAEYSAKARTVVRQSNWPSTDKFWWDWITVITSRICAHQCTRIGLHYPSWASKHCTVLPWALQALHCRWANGALAPQGVFYYPCTSMRVCITSGRLQNYCIFNACLCYPCTAMRVLLPVPRNACSITRAPQYVFYYPCTAIRVLLPVHCNACSITRAPQCVFYYPCTAIRVLFPVYRLISNRGGRLILRIWGDIGLSPASRKTPRRTWCRNTTLQYKTGVYGC